MVNYLAQQSLLAGKRVWQAWYLRLHSESAQSFLSESLGICLPASEAGSKSHAERASQSVQRMSVCEHTY